MIGVIPKMLERQEISHPNLTELFIVDSMHERKEKMSQLSDGFVALPGGPGTLEEFFEIFTWAQLGLHQKPCGLLNIQGYYDPLISLFDHMSTQQFIHEKFLTMLLVREQPDQLIDQFQAYEPPNVMQWLYEGRSE